MDRLTVTAVFLKGGGSRDLAISCDTDYTSSKVKIFSDLDIQISLLSS